MPIRSFRHPTTQILQAWGFCESNGTGEIAQIEPDGFNLEPDKWRWNGTAWEAVPQSELNAASTAAARTRAVNILSEPGGQSKLFRAVVAVLVDEINILRVASSMAPRTLAQARTAIVNKINSGDVDS